MSRIAMPNHLRRMASVKLSRLLRDHPVLQSEVLLLVAIFISLVCGSAAVALHRAIDLVAQLVHTGGVGISGPWRPWVVVLTPAAGGLVAGLILYFFVPAARGSGIPQVKLDLIMNRGVIPFKVALGKFITTAIAVGSGGSVGREGPTVQICASLGSTIARWFPMTTAQVRIMVHAACVSGLAAAFNTPIAGMTFVMEEVIGDLNARHLSYLILAAVGATMISRFWLGDEPIFLVPKYALGRPVELGIYLLLGVLAALVAVAFIRLLVWSIGRFQRLPLPEYFKPALGGLLVGLIALWLPQVLGIGYGTVTEAMQNHLPWKLMALLTVGKFLTTIISYSSGTAGGLFAPSLFIGAMLGGSLAGFLDDIANMALLTPGAFALVGMGAVFVGVIRTPITSILIIFEMTNDYALILPLMLANMTSYVLARALEPHNVYDAILAANNVHLPSPQDHYILEDLTAGEAMNRQPLTVSPDTPVAEVAALLERSPAPGFPIVTADQRLVGVVTFTDVRRALGKGLRDVPVLSIATKNVVTVYPDHTLNWVMQQLGEHELSFVPVVTRGNPSRLIGILTMSDIVRAFARSKAVR
ncbi:MAG: Cl- channel voltage-gated family protein [Candidatus Tectimicrobiota bacterium]|nr:MAG: Cl- channel voltage-gated family protein [Candidatus Tectomicrobia bacterium]